VLMKRLLGCALIGLLFFLSVSYSRDAVAQEVKTREREYIGKIIKISPAQVLLEKKRSDGVIIRNHFKIDDQTISPRPLKAGDTVKVTFRLRNWGKRSRSIRIATKIDLIDASRQASVVKQPDEKRY
jgi:hypothetical protein